MADLNFCHYLPILEFLNSNGLFRIWILGRYVRFFNLNTSGQFLNVGHWWPTLNFAEFGFWTLVADFQFWTVDPGH